MLYVANVGHSRAVIAFKEGNEIQASEITTDHVPSNVSTQIRFYPNLFWKLIHINHKYLITYCYDLYSTIKSQKRSKESIIRHLVQSYPQTMDHFIYM